MAQSAFIVRVPEAEPFVAGLRARLDPSALLGVPAHVTLLYPFMAPEQISAAELEQVHALAAQVPAFEFRLLRTGRFPGCLYLAPEPAAPFIALTQGLGARFPAFLPYGGQHGAVPVPHLTVAQTGETELAAAEAELLAALRLPARVIVARCREFVLIENTSGHWRAMAQFALAAAAGS